MKKTALLVAAAAITAISAPAFAQSDDSFTGPRVEALLGYDNSRAGSTADDDLNEDNNKSIDGLSYGVGLGYDYDMGNVVLGLEGEFMDSTAKTDIDASDAFGLGSVEASRDLYVGARLGYKVTPTTLLYAKGGYTNARYNVLANDGTVDIDQHLDTDGWRAGVGFEQKLNKNAFAKLEYRYSNYSEAEVDFENADLADSGRFGIDTDRHQIVAGLGWRF